MVEERKSGTAQYTSASQVSTRVDDSYFRASKVSSIEIGQTLEYDIVVDKLFLSVYSFKKYSLQTHIDNFQDIHANMSIYWERKREREREKNSFVREIHRHPCATKTKKDRNTHKTSTYTHTHEER